MEAKIKRFLAGYGDGDGSGYGDGDGSGYGDGDGYVEKLTRLHGSLVYYIDGIPCIFESVHDTWAAVLVINCDDFTTKKAVIAKLDGYFAHGETVKESFAAVTEKIMNNMDFDEKKKTFFEKFPSMSEEYQTMDFYSWHHVLTGSCDMGRRMFAREKNIDLDGTMTVKQFFELTNSAYGGERIKELESMYEG